MPQGNFHDNILQTHSGAKKDVKDKYQIIETLAEGSMGFVSLVKLKDSAVGGSAMKSVSSELQADKKKKEKESATGTSGGSGVKSIMGKDFHNYKSKAKELQFKLGRKLNRGDVVTLSPCERRQIEVLYALKEIRLDRIRSKDRQVFVDELMNEIAILKTMDHPHIVKAHEVYETKNQIYLVMEICYGGDLHDRAPYSEKEAARISEDLLSAILYLHKHGIVHRDLKQENIVFESDLPNARIKVIDFGLSKKFTGGQEADEDMKMTAWVGTRYTMAPEIFKREYTSQVDLWSVGVIIYMCICDNFPFYHANKKKMVSIIQSGKFSMSGKVWDGVSKECKDIIKRLLVVDAKKRLTAEKALQHKWFDKQLPLNEAAPSEESLREIGEHLLNYRKTTDLKRIALNIIAKNSTSKEIIKLRKVFESYDENHDGVITLEEFRKGLSSGGGTFSDEEINDVFKSIDINGTGHIMYTEFLAATVEAHGRIEEERVAQAFDRIDEKGDGEIDKKELVDILGKKCPKSQVKEIMNPVDKDGDGKISYAEFRRLFRKSTISLQDKVADLTAELGDTDI